MPEGRPLGTECLGRRKRGYELGVRISRRSCSSVSPVDSLCFVAFRFVAFRFVAFRFVAFRFVAFCFVALRRLFGSVPFGSVPLIVIEVTSKLHQIRRDSRGFSLRPQAEDEASSVRVCGLSTSFCGDRAACLHSRVVGDEGFFVLNQNAGTFVAHFWSPSVQPHPEFIQDVRTRETQRYVVPCR
jgi:hypothetical protein